MQHVLTLPCCTTGKRIRHPDPFRSTHEYKLPSSTTLVPPWCLSLFFLYFYNFPLPLFVSFSLYKLNQFPTIKYPIFTWNFSDCAFSLDHIQFIFNFIDINLYFSSLFIFLRCFCSSKSLPHLFFSYYSQIPRFCFLLLPWILLSWMMMVFQNWMIMIPTAAGLSNSNFHSQDYLFWLLHSPHLSQNWQHFLLQLPMHQWPPQKSQNFNTTSYKFQKTSTFQIYLHLSY